MSEWELKTQRKHTTALLTLFHLEPSPRALHIADYLLANYGWRHQEAGKKYLEDEKSFRQTLSYRTPTGRGFFVDIDDHNRRIFVSFYPAKTAEKLSDCKHSLIDRCVSQAGIKL